MKPNLFIRICRTCIDWFFGVIYVSVCLVLFGMAAEGPDGHTIEMAGEKIDISQSVLILAGMALIVVPIMSTRKRQKRDTKESQPQD